MSCQPSALRAGAPVHDWDSRLALVIANCFMTAICFPAANDFSNALVMKDLPEVVERSVRARFRAGQISNPYPRHYSAAFAFSSILYPLRLRLVLRPPYPGGAHRAYPVPLVYPHGLEPVLRLPKHVVSTPRAQHLRQAYHEYLFLAPYLLVQAFCLATIAPSACSNSRTLTTIHICSPCHATLTP